MHILKRCLTKTKPVAFYLTDLMTVLIIIYPLSAAENNAMEIPVAEALKQENTHLSTLPLLLQLNFSLYKKNVLIIFVLITSLKHVTIKYHYPLPLVPAVLEHL